MKTKSLLGAVALLALGLIFAFRATRQIEQANAELAALLSQRMDTSEKIARLDTQLQNARTALDDLERTSATATSSSNGTTAATAGVGAATKPVAPPRKLSPKTILTGDAQKLAQYLKEYRGELDWDYGWLFKRLKLTPEQIEKFKDIEIGLQETSMDLQAAIELQKLDADSPEYKKLWKDYNDARVTKKAELLGDGIVPYLELYRTNSVRYYAQQLAWTGVYTGETVTAAQIEQASDILVANSKRRVTDNYPGWVDQNGLNWPAASEALKTVLSPTQIATIGYAVSAYDANAKVNARATLLTTQFKKEHGGR